MYVFQINQQGAVLFVVVRVKPSLSATDFCFPTAFENLGTVTVL